jgi:uncharacterized integral membrane protein
LNIHWQVIRVSILILGVVLLLGVLLYGYTDSGDFVLTADSSDRPYNGLGLIVVTIGIIMVIVGLASPSVIRRTETVGDDDLASRTRFRRRIVVKEEYD